MASQPVVVGIDGSGELPQAVEWAALAPPCTSSRHVRCRTGCTATRRRIGEHDLVHIHRSTSLRTAWPGLTGLERKWTWRCC
jgi:hypothetical protein